MDYIVLLALLGITLLCLLISYNIVCQWWKNFGYRMVHYPRHIQLDLNTIKVVTAVPSFHIQAHGPDFQQAFSLAFLPCIGSTVGEEVETGWSHMNPATPSIKEMLPGHRYEVLDDY
jgi:hypothetical protein